MEVVTMKAGSGKRSPAPRTKANDEFNYLTSRFIDVFNKAQLDGHKSPVVMDAAINAAACYSVHGLGGRKSGVTGSEVDFVLRLFRYRMIDFGKLVCPEFLSPELLGTKVDMPEKD
jgi:hypothetical protein